MISTETAPDETQSPTDIDDQLALNSPEAVPKTFLQLTDDQMKKLVTRACDRITECRTDMGIAFAQRDANYGSWMWDRRNARDQYNGNMEWRVSRMGGVFAENNWTMNVPARFIRLMAAKMADDLIGSDPAFAAMPAKSKDPALSKQIEAKLQDEVTRSNFQSAIYEAIRTGVTEGGQSVKITHVTRQSTFYGPATVMVDQGQPVKTSRGEYIYFGDTFFQDPLVQGQLRLSKDPSFVVNQPVGWTPTTQYFDRLKQTEVEYEGLDTSLLFAEDFIYPIYMPFDDADIKVHCYDDNLDNIKRLYSKWATGQNYIDLAATGKLAFGSQPILEQGENQSQVTSVIESINIHETYIKGDFDEDGEEETIYMILDFKNRECIYAEYLQNMKMKIPPFILIPGVEKVSGRPYYKGVYKMWGDQNLFVDLTFNRVALKSSKEGSVTFQHKDGTQAGIDGRKIVIGGREIYEIPAATMYGKDRPPIFRVNLNEVDEFSIKQMEEMINSGQLLFGIISAADGSSDDLNASGTATGVRNIERTGNLLQRATENDMAEAIEAALEMACWTVLQNMDKQEVAGIPGEDQIALLNRDEIWHLFDAEGEVKLLLTKAKSSESLQTNAQADAIVNGYYAKPEWLKRKVRQFAINQLKALDVPDADEVLDEPTDEQIQAEAQAQQAAAAAANAPKPPSISIAAKVAFTPEEAQQIKQKDFQITPSSPEEVASYEAQQKAQDSVHPPGAPPNVTQQSAIQQPPAPTNQAVQ